jgi:hypothetical protein
MDTTFLEMLEDPALLTERLQRHRGPVYGRGPGQPWAGIAEETPQPWVTWLADASKRLGRPLPEVIEVDERRVLITTVQLTFGPRPYFACPHCSRRTEVLYFLATMFGCRRCCKLGYCSQQHRPTSVWGALDLLYSRAMGRWELPNNALGDVVHEMRVHLLSEIDQMLNRVTVPDKS